LLLALVVMTTFITFGGLKGSWCLMILGTFSFLDLSFSHPLLRPVHHLMTGSAGPNISTQIVFTWLSPIINLFAPLLSVLELFSQKGFSLGFPLFILLGERKLYPLFANVSPPFGLCFPDEST